MRTFRFVLSLSLLLLLQNEIIQAQWKQTGLFSSPGTVKALAVSSTSLYAGTWGRGVYTSTDNGTSWNEGLNNQLVNALTVSGDKLFTGLNNGFNPSPDGLGSMYVNSVQMFPCVYSIVVSGTNLFAGTDFEGVFLSTNNAKSWTQVNSGLTNPLVRALAVSGTNLFAGTYGGGVFLSTNNGTNWTNVGLVTENILSLEVSGTNLFAGAEFGVFLSTNSGTSWTNIGLPNSYVRAFAVSGTNIFAGTGSTPTSPDGIGGGVFLSTNNGTSWAQVNSGLSDTSVWSLAISGNNLFAGTSKHFVYRRPLLEMVTGVKDNHNQLPTRFSLEQNYPNPFNPATTISFSLPTKSFVSLKVYDALGREVATILSEELSAGTYSRQWNAASIPSGIYFYHLHAGSFTETKKLVLLK